MSYYCKGEKCNLRGGCLRADAWDKFPKKDTPTGFPTGLWLVDENECMSKNFFLGVFAFQQLEVLDLVLMGKWFDMILSGKKREEYRKIIPYWTRRLIVHTPYKFVRFHRGYTNIVLLFKIDSIDEGYGDPSLGAPEEKVYIIRFH